MKLTAMEQKAMRLVARHQGFTAPELAHIARLKGPALKLVLALIDLEKKGLLTRGENRVCGQTLKDTGKLIEYPTYRTAEPPETERR